MQQNSDPLNGTIQISDKFDIAAAPGDINATPVFAAIGSEYTLSFTNLEKVEKFTSFRYDTLGMTSDRYLSNTYRISRDGNSWSDWMPLNRNIESFPLIDSKDPLYPARPKYVFRAGCSAQSLLLPCSFSGKLLNLCDAAEAIQSNRMNVLLW